MKGGAGVAPVPLVLDSLRLPPSPSAKHTPPHTPFESHLLFFLCPRWLSYGYRHGKVIKVQRTNWAGDGGTYLGHCSVGKYCHIQSVTPTHPSSLQVANTLSVLKGFQSVSQAEVEQAVAESLTETKEMLSSRLASLKQGRGVCLAICQCKACALAVST